ncbi:MAG TPA: helix-turn-helix domain-containing protein [Candidatus Binatia bacterium]|jgi:transposase|nr:helix-turn-helix domain-containing protein [Candidatus Binatia bacterium]
MALLALNSQERGDLQDLLTPLALTNAVRRAQALLWLDAGHSPETVAARLGVSRQTVYNWATRFKERRDTCDVSTRLADDKRPGRGKTTAPLIDPLIEAVLTRDPHEFGYCAPRWTPTLLERYLRNVANITVCRRSVSLALKRLGHREQLSSPGADPSHMHLHCIIL